MQDSPILGDVWIEFGKAPDQARDLLISPYKTQHAGFVAARIVEDMRERDVEKASIAYLQGLVVARLTFEQVLKVIIPKTKWWIDRWTEKAAQEGAAEPSYEHEVTRKYFDAPNSRALQNVMDKIIRSAQAWYGETGERGALEVVPLDRFVALAGLILWAAQKHNATQQQFHSADRQIGTILAAISGETGEVENLLTQVANDMLKDKTYTDVKSEGEKPLVWSVSRNRAALPAIVRSVPAVKAGCIVASGTPHKCGLGSHWNGSAKAFKCNVGGWTKFQMAHSALFPQVALRPNVPRRI